LNRNHRIAASLVLLPVIGFSLTGCLDDTKTQETKRKEASYERLVSQQPAEAMGYSPTRESLNQWVKTWGKPNQLSYVYIQNAKGEYGYFVMKNLPVPRCKMLTPNTKPYGDSGRINTEMPGMDGTYTAPGTCNAYFGFDATTGAYMEFTIGMNQSFFLFNSAMTLPEFKSATPLGPTTLKN
jgi:hypothetical protein